MDTRRFKKKMSSFESKLKCSTGKRNSKCVRFKVNWESLLPVEMQKQTRHFETVAKEAR